jgi:RNA 2',3'-cyclic 3'-phosphodiesterase
MRMFIGLPAPPEIRRQWASLFPKVRNCGVRASWVAPENLHITVKFLGDTDEAGIGGVAEAMKAAFGGLRRTLLPSEGIGFFPHERRPRVLFVRFARDPVLSAGQEQLEDRLEALGFAREERPFEVHMTLARIKEPWPQEAARRAVVLLSADPWPDFPLVQAALFESTLTPAGAVYALRKAVEFPQ